MNICGYMNVEMNPSVHIKICVCVYKDYSYSPWEMELGNKFFFVVAAFFFFFAVRSMCMGGNL